MVIPLIKSINGKRCFICVVSSKISSPLLFTPKSAPPAPGRLWLLPFRLRLICQYRYSLGLFPAVLPFLGYSPLSGRTIPICCSIFVFKLYHKTCEQFYRNFGLYEKSPNSFLPGLPRSIINQFRFHNLLCLCLASVHLPHPFHLVFGFQLLGHAVLLCQ